MSSEHEQMESIPPDSEGRAGLSRRALLGATAVAGGAGLIGFAHSGAVSASEPSVAGSALLAPTIDGLTYLTLDAYAFDVADTNPAAYRLYQQATGMQPQPAPGEVYASLPIPIGSVVKQLNIGYQGTPSVAVVRRDLAGAVTDLTPITGLAGGGGAKTQTLPVDGTLTHGASYAVRVFCSAGDSVLGMTIGYAPPTAASMPPAPAFVPFAGTVPRVLDTRSGARLAAGEERVVDLTGAVLATAQAAVVNVTAVGVGGRGFLSVYREGIAFPGSSSVNYSAAGQTVANGVITATTNGKITVRAGDTSTHVLVDVIGSLL